MTDITTPRRHGRSKPKSVPVMSPPSCFSLLHSIGDGGNGRPSNPRIQAFAMKLIAIVFIIYAWGFIASILSLPDIKADASFLTFTSNESAHWFGFRYKSADNNRSKTVGKILNVSGGKILSQIELDGDKDDDDHEKLESKSEEAANVGADVGGDDVDVDVEAIKEKDLPDDDEEYDKIEAKMNGDGNDDEKLKSKSEEAADIEAKMNRAEEKLQNKNGIPKAVWPVISTNRQKDQWIELAHPGDPAMTISLPKFWSPPVHNNEQFTRTKAMQIGTCITPDQDGNYQRGDECPLNDRTIFVAIASYRDWQCKYTVTSIFARAKYPQRIRVAVVDQIVEGDDICDEPIYDKNGSCEENPDQAICKYASQIDNYRMDAPMAVGPVVARHIGHRQYRGEYYSMQSDAHVTFTQDWDADIIEQQEAIGDEMAVLTTYLTDIVGSIDQKTGKSLRHTRPIMCNTDYEGGPQGMHLRHLSQPERTPPAFLTMPQLEPWWAAGFSFSRGHFLVNVPYDFYQAMIFQGEEMSIGIRGFTIGYDFYAPQRSVCFHHYAENSKDRVHVPHFWENTNKYAGTGKASMARLLGMVHMNPEVPSSSWNHVEEEIYGIGKVRTPEMFYETFGIDVVNKKTVRKPSLCDFVQGGKMHKDFIPYLRSDGMGIDYNKITYKHH